jgi:hypothetical protein
MKLDLEGLSVDSLSNAWTDLFQLCGLTTIWVSRWDGVQRRLRPPEPKLLNHENEAITPEENMGDQVWYVRRRGQKDMWVIEQVPNY